MAPKPLVDKKYLLEKFPGKGGWTYAALPEINQQRDKYFGMLRVYGEIDGHPLTGKTLMPKGNGIMFLPVNASVRKAIGKGEGDHVHLKLYPEKPFAEEKAVDFSSGTPLKIPEDIMDCFKTEPPEAYRNFQHLPEDQKRHWLQWIYEVKQEDSRAERIVKMMDNLLYSTR
ncbi:YdeI/OmpD-associated family protein [Sinomicrobium weinanense]|uniref:DUF1905 domain-containing protein n=1 Tax=Sinomicrobium weinanense TaxID=2842200 RepID=A0A926JQN9_9FLAO|nr:YdeI/OmpD-associated family protein [Sinomicrobium weinanense]MBC9795486.1 DUF1905 domain-containing protein [Sinomicrobium weinanense]MBU3123367.1 YdeI/OmpD-associated family protein [Sinomicrobium weinanense]